MSLTRFALDELGQVPIQVVLRMLQGGVPRGRHSAKMETKFLSLQQYQLCLKAPNYATLFVVVVVVVVRL
jgi:hypothetical protein